MKVACAFGCCKAQPREAAPDEAPKRSVAVNLTEPLGNETLVFLDFAGRDWVSRMLNPRPLAAGALLPVSFDLSHAHLFDAATGVALAREEV